MPNPQKNLSIVLFASGLANYDRFVTSPILVAISLAYGASFVEAAAIASIHHLTYGLSQVAWGVISDQFGRLLVLRISLIGLAAGSLFSVFATNISELWVARGVTGLFCGALIPTTITYIGDVISSEKRQNVMADMLAYMAVGSAIATGLSGAISQYLSFKLVFLIVSVATVFIFFNLSRDFDSNSANVKSTFGHSLIAAIKSPWVILISSFTFIEGLLVLGTLSLLPTILQYNGLTAGAAGVVAALYGISVLVSTRFVKYVSASAFLPMSLGGLSVILAAALPAFFEGLVTLASVAVLLGISWAFFHSSLQTWMTTILPSSRATCVALMTSTLFLGGGLGTSFGSQLVESQQIKLLFQMALIAAVILVTTGILFRSIYRKKFEAQ